MKVTTIIIIILSACILYKLFLDKREVDKLFEIKFSDFLKLENKGIRSITVGKRNLTVPGFAIQNQWIWGATALIINEIVEVIVS